MEGGLALFYDSLQVSIFFWLGFQLLHTMQMSALLAMCL